MIDRDSVPQPTTAAMWVPNLSLSRAAALAVPLGQPYNDAIRDKLVGLLEKAGKKRARAAVQAYLERSERDILGRAFPDGWAEAILWTDAVCSLVSAGDPDLVDAADPELTREALAEDAELDLESFLAATPGGGGLD